MPRITTGRTRYEGQRRKVTPPHVSLGDMRVATGMTIDQVIAGIAEVTGRKPLTRGAISGIENGHRGASQDLLRAMEIVYGLREGAITTTYRPRAANVSAA